MGLFVKPASVASSYLLTLGILFAPSNGQAATSVQMDSLKKAGISLQLEAKENEQVNSDVIVRYCACVAKHGIEVLTDQQFEEAGRLGHPGAEMQKKLTALGETCLSCIINPCKGE
jgi:hypothetical protein